jgi:phage shock protein A
MKKYLKSFLWLILTVYVVNFLSAADPEPDTTEGILYEVLFEQYPLEGLTVRAQDTTDIISRLIMFNQLEEHFSHMLDRSASGKKETYKQKLDKIKDKLTEKVESSIKELIQDDIVKVIDKRNREFVNKGPEKTLLTGVKNIFWDNPRQKIARKITGKAREDYKDILYFQVNPADTQQKIGTNNIAFLYEELFELVAVSRKVGDLVTAYIFLTEKNIQTTDITTNIKSIANATNRLYTTLTDYINDLIAKKSAPSMVTTDNLKFFAQQYQQDALTIIKGISDYLIGLARNKKTEGSLTAKNRDDLYLSTIFPALFDKNVRETVSDLEATIKSLETNNNKLSEEVKKLKRRNQDLESKILKIESKGHAKSTKKSEEKIEIAKQEKSRIGTSKEASGKLKSGNPKITPQKTTKKSAAQSEITIFNPKTVTVSTLPATFEAEIAKLKKGSSKDIVQKHYDRYQNIQDILKSETTYIQLDNKNKLDLKDYIKAINTTNTKDLQSDYLVVYNAITTATQKLLAQKGYNDPNVKLKMGE